MERFLEICPLKEGALNMKSFDEKEEDFSIQD
jgi:hypothetical protein